MPASLSAIIEGNVFGRLGSYWSMQNVSTTASRKASGMHLYTSAASFHVC